MRVGLPTETAGRFHITNVRATTVLVNGYQRVYFAAAEPQRPYGTAMHAAEPGDTVEVSLGQPLESIMRWEEPPTAQELDEWRSVMENENLPDKHRAICAMALLHDGQRQWAHTDEVAEVLGWDIERTKTALEAAVEAGHTSRAPEHDE